MNVVNISVFLAIIFNYTFVDTSGANMSLSGDNFHAFTSPAGADFLDNDGNGWIDKFSGDTRFGDDNPEQDQETPWDTDSMGVGGDRWEMIRRRCQSIDYYQSFDEQHQSAEQQAFPHLFASSVKHPRVIIPPSLSYSSVPRFTTSGSSPKHLDPRTPSSGGVQTDPAFPQQLLAPHIQSLHLVRTRFKASTGLRRTSASVDRRRRRWVMGRRLNCSDQEQKRPSSFSPRSGEDIVNLCEDTERRRRDLRRRRRSRESSQIFEDTNTSPIGDQRADDNNGAPVKRRQISSVAAHLTLPSPREVLSVNTPSSPVGEHSNSVLKSILPRIASGLSSLVYSATQSAASAVPSVPIGSARRAGGQKRRLGPVLIDGRPTVYLLGLCLLLMAPNSTSASCRMKFCDFSFANALEAKKLLSGANLPYCLNLNEYFLCQEATRLACRGNLRFHAMFTLTKNQMKAKNCSEIIKADIKEQKMAMGVGDFESRGQQPSVNRGQGGARVSPIGSDYNTRLVPMITADSNGPSSSRPDLASGSVIDLTPGVIGQPVGDIMPGRCLFPYHHQSGASGFRHCGLFGDPHLRTFSGQQETCRTVGAWPLVDNAFLAVQVTNSPIAPGLSASGITKITVIVRSLVGCSEQKTYEATSLDLPSAFVDGSSESPNPVRNMDSYAYASYSSDDDDFSEPAGSSHRHPDAGPTLSKSGRSRSQPAVQVRTLVPNEHIQIRLRYVATKISIRRVAGYLSFAIRIPDEVVQKKSAVSSLQLCMSGCPSDERIAYKEVLSDPETFVPRMGLKHPAMPRSEAIEICRDAGTVDFYFDSCVFDLVTSGDPGFSLAAVRAQTDVRTLYPPYRRHYETNRTSLDIYDNFAAGSSLAGGSSSSSGHVGRYDPSELLDTDNRRRSMSSSAGDRPTSKAAPATAGLSTGDRVLLVLWSQLLTWSVTVLVLCPPVFSALMGFS